MVALYYISQYVPMFRLPGGLFSLVDTGGGIPTNAPRLAIHGVWQPQTTGHYFEVIKPSGARGKAKDACMVYVRAPDVDPLNLHALIQADTNNTLVPWTPDNLDDVFGTLSSTVQAQVRNALESVFMDGQWMTGATPFRSIMSYALHVIFAASVLGADYPDGPLNGRWNGFTAAQQAAVQDYLARFGLPAISGNPERREVVNSLARADWGPTGNPVMGGVRFGAWSP